MTKLIEEAKFENCWTLAGIVTSEIKPYTKSAYGNQQSFTLLKFTLAVERYAHKTKKIIYDYFTCVVFDKDIIDKCTSLLCRNAFARVRGIANINKFTTKDGQEAKAFQLNVQQIDVNHCIKPNPNDPDHPACKITTNYHQAPKQDINAHTGFITDFDMNDVPF
jgi:single-stranded DNA-binding protein